MQYILCRCLQAHLPQVLGGVALPNELEELDVAFDNLSGLAFGQIALAKVGVPPAKDLEREDMELYVSGWITHAKCFVEVAGSYQFLKAFVLSLHILFVALRMFLRIDGEGLPERPEEAQLLEELNAVHDPLVQVLHHATDISLLG